MLFSMLGGCAEWRGMQRCRFIGFSCIFVTSFPFSILMVRSRKLTSLHGPEDSQVRLLSLGPNVLRSCANLACMPGVWSWMAKMSSMNRRQKKRLLGLPLQSWLSPAAAPERRLCHLQMRVSSWQLQHAVANAQAGEVPMADPLF